MRARLLHLEDAALHAHLAAAVAGGAGLDLAVFRTRALAGLARDERRHFDALLDAGHGLLEVQLHHVADVGAAPRTARAPPPPKMLPKMSPKMSPMSAQPGPAAAAAHAVFERGMAVLVVHAALAAVGQHFVGFLALLERGFRGVVAGIAVRVVLHRAAAIGLLQVFVAGVAGHAQDFVVVALAHGAGFGVG